MNKKAEDFKKYLETKSITCFAVEEIEEDQLNTVVFRATIEVEGQQLPTIIILDSSIYGMIRVLAAPGALKENNELELLRQLNTTNGKYKVFKYYLGADGGLYLESCVLLPKGKAEGDLIYTVLDVIIRHLQEEYKNIMKLIWQ